MDKTIAQDSPTTSGASIQDKLNEIRANILRKDVVSVANNQSEMAEKRIEQLKISRERLKARAAEISSETRQLNALCEEILTEKYAGETKQTDTSDHFHLLRDLETEHRIVKQAASRVTEHLLPKAEITGMRATAAFSKAQAVVMRDIAAERMSRTEELMAEAAQHEGEISYDPTRTVSGILIAQAQQLELTAGSQERVAYEREQDYSRTLKPQDSTTA